MYEPLVSIIIPVYNGSNYLAEAIDSALAQTYDRVEIIVVNDGSNDNNATENIALSYGDKIRYFYKDNGGVSTALNYGIKKMEGEWFSWLSHDDLYMPNKIKSQIEKLCSIKGNCEETIISCNGNLVDSNGKAIFSPKRFYPGFFNAKEMYKNLFNGRILGGCSLLIHKKVLMDVDGFPTEYKYIQDWVCWIKMAMRGYNFYLFDENLVKSRVHEDQGQSKLANLYPKEYKEFLYRLLMKLGENGKENSYYIKTVLFYECTKMKESDIRKKYIYALLKNDEFSKFDNIKYIFYLVRGYIIRLLKRLYRYVINIRFRGAK